MSLQRRLLDAWDAWDRRPSEVFACVALEDALAEFAALAGVGGSHLREGMADARREGLRGPSALAHALERAQERQAGVADA